MYMIWICRAIPHMPSNSHTGKLSSNMISQIYFPCKCL